MINFKEDQRYKKASLFDYFIFKFFVKIIEIVYCKEKKKFRNRLKLINLNFIDQRSFDN